VRVLQSICARNLALRVSRPAPNKSFGTIWNYLRVWLYTPTSMLWHGNTSWNMSALPQGMSCYKAVCKPLAHTLLPAPHTILRHTKHQNGRTHQSRGDNCSPSALKPFTCTMGGHAGPLLTYSTCFASLWWWSPLIIGSADACISASAILRCSASAVFRMKTSFK
jgi:hypothetical protein